jgi:ribosomal-protein-alanine N-acetyltransferase
MMADFDFSTFPTLVTPRLILREFTPADAADLFSFRSDPEVAKYDSDPPMQEVTEAAGLIEQIGKHYTAKESLGWAVVLKEEKRVIGDFVFFFWERAYYKADLGYCLARPYWRQGLATEALRAILQFGFDTLHVHRVNADTRMDNLASTRLLEKVGFRHEGVRRECIRSADGTYQNWGLYGLLEDEYRELM